jgi:ubiquinone/menaquinone biosynthesis C-methylase UbiE
MVQKEEIIKLYQREGTAKNFDDERKEFLYQRYKHKIEANILKKILKVNNGPLKVLDVACGTGRMVPEIFKGNPNVEYTGLDTSNAMTAFLKHRAKILDKEKQIKLIIGDATKLPFKDNTFDVAFTYHLTWHLPKEEQIKMIKELERVTKKGGYFVFDILNSNFVYEKFKSKNLEGIYKINPDDVKKIISSQDIKIEKLNDAIITNPLKYSIFNIINNIKKLLPLNMYHMLYFVVRNSK